MFVVLEQSNNNNDILKFYIQIQVKKGYGLAEILWPNCKVLEFKNTPESERL